MLKKAMSLLLAIVLLSSAAVFAAYSDGVYIGDAYGHNGPIEVEVTVANGQITDIRILQSEETPIISDAAFAGVSAEIINRQAIDVETVTGATVSSRALISAVKDALEDPGYQDGTYEVTTYGHNGPVSFRIVIANGRISQIEVTESGETPIISDAAFEGVSQAILAKQDTDVATVTGATVSSRAMIAAVNQVLKSSAATTELVFKDGVFEGSAQGFNAPVKVQVTIEGGRLSKIDVLEHAETRGLGDRAFDVMIPEMIEAQTVEVDLVSGATISSEALIDAVRDALN